jgi:hypothetical protein
MTWKPPMRGPSKLWRNCITAMLFFACAFHSTAADTQLNPIEFKAAIVAKVLPYVQWPKETLPEPRAPFLVGVFGNDPVEPILATLLKDQKLNGRDIIVQRIDTATNALPRCQLLFVPATHEARWQALSKDAAIDGILTVGESETFTKSGGVFNVLVDQQKLEISVKNAKRAGLDINSKLLKISKVVR